MPALTKGSGVDYSGSVTVPETAGDPQRSEGPPSQKDRAPDYTHHVTASHQAGDPNVVWSAFTKVDVPRLSLSPPGHDIS